MVLSMFCVSIGVLTPRSTLATKHTCAWQRCTACQLQGISTASCFRVLPHDTVGQLNRLKTWHGQQSATKKRGYTQNLTLNKHVA